MPDLKTAIILVGIVLGCCVLLAAGAFVGKRVMVNNLLTFTGVVALIAIILYVIYAAWFLLTR